VGKFAGAIRVPGSHATARPDEMVAVVSWLCRSELITVRLPVVSRGRTASFDAQPMVWSDRAPGCGFDRRSLNCRKIVWGRDVAQPPKSVRTRQWWAEAGADRFVAYAYDDGWRAQRAGGGSIAAKSIVPQVWATEESHGSPGCDFAPGACPRRPSPDSRLC